MRGAVEPGGIATLERERRPAFVAVLPEVEVRRHYADDFVWFAVGADDSSNDGGIAAELALPERVAQDHDAIQSALVFAGTEVAADLRCHAEHPEEIGGDAERDDQLGFA